MLPCLNKKLFGVDCLGCGMQRSIVLLLKGDFIGAFHMYPAIYPLIFLLLFLGFNFFVKFKNDWLIKLSLIIISALTIIVSYLIKMKIIF
ncbi:DUF2752 domain-containing protein [Aquimarina sp. 2201CG5-10]|uniref:DUF2752 domain-containing protein n=1 Tax=Aquimarina callyspongiae TaxID=3098150 RepID=UPI002AB5605D|nr:DUF2752 domain-containing protein [Aquimarina sp. 2201CG5-10]MDY8138974.1 DUF2752 domain-containing protein [Aquimarina sp. 2201CG5-10]